ncbi:DUF6986 family protein [Georgenia sp. Z1491]|uniref:DUF6986 family protein n=1 Tax=Georgenia sp. Z1491 TaxID=3416707 RepID=UPI003CE75AC2
MTSSSPSLAPETLAEVDAMLDGADERLEADYPGDDGTRQPVHTVYVPAHRFRAGLAHEWGGQALEVIERGGGTAELLAAVGVPDELRESVGALVTDKLATEPVEDLRIDLEDGYGDHGDAEDDDALAAARAVRAEIDAGTSTPFVGIRFKCLERATRARGVRTLDLVVGELASSGPLPDGFVLTLPKVTSVEQVEAMVVLCERLEAVHGLPAGRLRFEIQVETPQAVLGADGTALVARMIHAGAPRVTGLHYGTYDYSASLGIAARYQSMEHPAADHAKAVMQLAAAGTGVRLSDGSTNVLPVGDADQVRAAWSLHGRLVRRSLERGYHQGWDMHPGHLPGRFAVTYAYYREGFLSAAQRLRAYLSKEEGAVMDEPATARALAWFLARGLDCGAISAAEVEGSVGAGVGEVDALAGRPPGRRN